MNISDELAELLQQPRDLGWIEGATGGFLKQVLKISQNLQEYTYARVSFFNEVADLPQLFIKRVFHTGISPEILRRF